MDKNVELQHTKHILNRNYTKYDGKKMDSLFLENSLQLKHGNNLIQINMPQTEGIKINNKVTSKDDLAKITEIYFTVDYNYRLEVAINDTISYYLEFKGNFPEAKEIIPNRLLTFWHYTDNLYLLSAHMENDYLKIKAYSDKETYQNTCRLNDYHKIILDITDKIR